VIVTERSVALSRGAVAIWLARQDMEAAGAVHARAGWHYGSQSPLSYVGLVPQPSLSFAGFHLCSAADTGGNRVRVLILPLWPLLLSAVPPLVWWRYRRGAQGRGFALTAAGSPPHNTPMQRAGGNGILSLTGRLCTGR
jgi:hypothetical protein